MKMRIIFLLAVLTLSAPVLIPYAQEAVLPGHNTENKSGLSEILGGFPADNPQIRILEGRLAAARAEERSARLLPNPGVGYRVERAGDTDTFIEGSWPLDVSGRRRLSRKAAKAGTASAENLYAWQIHSLFADVETLFFELLAGQERLRIAEEGARRYESILNNVRSRAGETDYDRLRLEKELSEIKADANEASRDVIDLRSDFAVLLNRDPNELELGGKIKNEEPIPDYKILQASILSGHPRVAAALKQAEKRQLERKAARRRWFPDLNLTGGFKSVSGEGNRDSGFTAGLSIALPLFDRGQADADLAQAEGSIADAAAVIAKQEILQSFSRTYQDARLLKTAVQEYETALLNAERLEQMAGLAYLEGRLGILELLDAYRGAIESRLRFINMTLEARLSEIELRRIVGRPFEELKEEKA